MNVTIETKVCTKCGEDKPFSEYGKRKGAKDGHRNDCKACVSAYKKAYDEANHERLAAQQKAHYEANREKILAEKKAYYEANRDEIRAKQGVYQETNREKLNDADKAYREANREKIAASDKAYREANREKVSATNKAYREANREKLAAQKKAYHAEKWANDPEYRARYIANSIKRKRLIAEAKQEPYIREDIFERDNWTCGLCQEPIDSELKYPDSGYASIDHILPISLGGDDTPANVQAAHLSCNRAKGNRVEMEDLQAA